MIFEKALNAVREQFPGASEGVITAIVVVVGLILVVGLVSLGVSIWLGLKYHKYNKIENKIGKTGEEIAREVLDDNGLQHIAVSKTGSFMFGNSYSHYFKKVRLRRLTWQKKSVTSMAMAVQKSSLAVLDKEGDPDMKTRVKLTPITFFGPIAFIPLILIGVLLDVLVFKTKGPTMFFVFTGFGLLLYALSFVMAIMELKTEVKAQKKALIIMEEQGIADAEEREICKELFKLYNIEYVNNLIIAMLEMLLRVLQIIAKSQSSSSTSK